MSSKLYSTDTDMQDNLWGKKIRFGSQERVKNAVNSILPLEIHNAHEHTKSSEKSLYPATKTHLGLIQCLLNWAFILGTLYHIIPINLRGNIPVA